MRRAVLPLVACVVFALPAGCADAPVRSLDELAVVDSVYVDPVSLEPYDGRVERRFDDTDEARVQIEGRLRDGVWDGELIVYHPNGRVRYMGSFESGERCGPWVENADSVAVLTAYEELVREVESMGLYPPCRGES